MAHIRCCSPERWTSGVESYSKSFGLDSPFLEVMLIPSAPPGHLECSSQTCHTSSKLLIIGLHSLVSGFGCQHCT